MAPLTVVTIMLCCVGWGACQAALEAVHVATTTDEVTPMTAEEGSRLSRVLTVLDVSLCQEGGTPLTSS